MLFIYIFFHSVEQIDQPVGRDIFCTIMEKKSEVRIHVPGCQCIRVLGLPLSVCDLQCWSFNVLSVSVSLVCLCLYVTYSANEILVNRPYILK